MKVTRQGVANGIFRTGPVLAVQAVAAGHQVMAKELSETRMNGSERCSEAGFPKPTFSAGVVGFGKDAVLGLDISVEQEGQDAGRELQHVNVDVEAKLRWQFPAPCPT